MTKLLVQIRQLVQTQNELMAALRSQFPNSMDMEFLIDFPKCGVVFVADKEWKFYKHGIGFEFTCGETGQVVDIHNHILRPEVFDIWRLDSYLRSLGLLDEGETSSGSVVNLEMDGTVRIDKETGQYVLS